MTVPQQLVQKLWNYCKILRDDCLSSGDLVEQLKFLLFHRMADEQSKLPPIDNAEKGAVRLFHDFLAETAIVPADVVECRPYSHP